MTPILEIFEVRASRKGQSEGWRFRMVTDDDAEAYVSNGLFPTAEAATKTAQDVNALMFNGEFQVALP